MRKLSFRREHFMYSYNKFTPQNLTFQTHHYYEVLFFEIQQCVSEEGLEFEVIVQTYIIQMVVAICDCISTSSGQPEQSSKKTQKIKQYINHNFTRALSLDEIAENVFFNKYYMCHVFKEDTGLTIKEYIELLRFMYARKLYAQGKKMTDIAALCGYGDYSLFYKNFTKYSGGRSPKEFFSMDTHSDSEIFPM